MTPSFENIESEDQVEKEYTITPSEEYIDDIELFQRIADESINKDGCSQRECGNTFTKGSEV